MKNNTKYKNLLSGAIMTLLGVSMVSCDNIAEDDRYILTDPVDPMRIVLVEDFTGQKCVNCPEAHAVIEGLKAQYGDAVVPVSIHGGPFAISRENTYFPSDYVGLGNPEGEYYNNLFGVKEWPQGMVNRRGGVLQYLEWPNLVKEELQRPSELGLNLTASLSDNSINIEIEMDPQADIEGNLQVWILESGIVGRQSSQSQGLIKDYVHDNVLRAAVNGNDGEKVSLRKGIHQKASYSITLRDNEEERWNPVNLSVVAFVYDNNGVHQTVRTKPE